MKYPSGYYVYAYLRKSGTPYYIGKGIRNRAFGKKRLYKPNDLSRIVIVEQNLTNLGALAIERRLIKWYGRKDLGTGILHNKTDGGDGVSERPVPDHERRQRSERQLGNLHFNFGKFGDSNPASKDFIVITPENQVIKIKGLHQFCKNNSLLLPNVSWHLNGPNKKGVTLSHVKKFRFFRYTKELFDELTATTPPLILPKRGSGKNKFMCRISDHKELSKPSAALVFPDLRPYF